MLGLQWAHDCLREEVLDGPDPGKHVRICPDTQLTCLRSFKPGLNRPVGGCHGLGTLLEAILNLVEAAMTYTDLLEADLNHAEAAMTSIDLLETVLMSTELLEAAMMLANLL
jgi:hypothetical protein